jgi:hypothetical protein
LRCEALAKSNSPICGALPAFGGDGINTPLDLKRSHPWVIRERLGVEAPRSLSMQV